MRWTERPGHLRRIGIVGGVSSSGLFTRDGAERLLELHTREAILEPNDFGRDAGLILEFNGKLMAISEIAGGDDFGARV
jgi:hypothetical protein